jgi:hypothetical protein
MSVRLLVMTAVVLAILTDTAPAQSLHGMSPWVMSGDARGYGGYDYDGRDFPVVAIGVDFPVLGNRSGELLAGVGYSPAGLPAGTLQCRAGAIRRACMEGFPEFGSRSLAITWRQTVFGFNADAAFEPTWFTYGSGASTFGPAARFAIAHRVWKGIALTANIRGSYLSSYDGQRLGMRSVFVGARRW